MAYEIHIDTGKSRKGVTALANELRRLNDEANSTGASSKEFERLATSINNLSAITKNMADQFTKMATAQANNARAAEAAVTKTLAGETRLQKEYLKKKALLDEMTTADGQALLKKIANVDTYTKAVKDSAKKAAEAERKAFEDSLANLKKSLAEKLRLRNEEKAHAQKLAHSIAALERKELEEAEAHRRALSHRMAVQELKDKEATAARRIALAHKVARAEMQAAQDEKDHRQKLMHSIAVLERKEAEKAIADANRVAAAKRRASAGVIGGGGYRGMSNELLDASQSAAMFRAAMLASGHSMGLFTAHTLVAAATVYGFVTALRSTIGAGAELENSMQRVYAISGALGERLTDVTEPMKLLSTSVRDVAKGTIFTANEVAKGAVEFSMAGFTAIETANALNATSALAAVGMTDMATSARTAANILNAFGLEATSLQEVVDRMAVAVTNSMMDIAQLSTALSYVGPLAKPPTPASKTP